jgi:hypothetical protein
MTIELIDIAVKDHQSHPRLNNRVVGHVRAVLAEQMDGREQRHELDIPVWADCKANTSDDDIEMALMVKAAGIVARLKANLVSVR